MFVLFVFHFDLFYFFSFLTSISLDPFAILIAPVFTCEALSLFAYLLSRVSYVLASESLLSFFMLSLGNLTLNFRAIH